MAAFKIPCPQKYLHNTWKKNSCEAFFDQVTKCKIAFLRKRCSCFNSLPGEIKRLYATFLWSLRKWKFARDLKTNIIPRRGGCLVAASFLVCAKKKSRKSNSKIPGQIFSFLGRGKKIETGVKHSCVENVLGKWKSAWNLKTNIVPRRGVPSFLL